MSGNWSLSIPCRHYWHWRCVRIGRADFDWRISLQAGLQLIDNFYHWVGDPRVLGTDIALLLEIGEQVDDFRQRKLLWRGVHVLLPYQVRLPVPPFDGRQPVSHVGGKSFAARIVLFAEQEIQLVHAID